MRDSMQTGFLPPHLHCNEWQNWAGVEFRGLFENETFAKLRGDLPPRALAFVHERAALHRQELRSDWQRARIGTPLEPIAPLD